MHLVQRLVELKSEERELVRRFELELLRLAKERVVKLPSFAYVPHSQPRLLRAKNGLD